MDNDNPYYQEDVVAYRSLSTVKDLEWRHLKVGQVDHLVWLNH